MTHQAFNTTGLHSPDSGSASPQIYGSRNPFGHNGCSSNEMCHSTFRPYDPYFLEEKMESIQLKGKNHHGSDTSESEQFHRSFLDESDYLHNNKFSNSIEMKTMTANTSKERFSPYLDQGYSTLVSGSVPQVIMPWTRKRRISGPYFDYLPDEAILKIFGWLDSYELLTNISSVCKRFHQLALRTQLWKNVTLKGDYISGDRTLKLLFRRLCGQGRNNVCPDIERIMLSEGCIITEKGLQRLSRSCPRISHLQLQGSTTLSNKAISEALTRLTNLQHLDISGCTLISHIEKLRDFNMDPPRQLMLQYLDLTDCSALDDIGLQLVITNSPLLVYLYLRRCFKITDSSLKILPSFCSSLRELSVSDCVNITDFGLYELATLGASLRYLSVAKCDQISDAGLKVIARRCYKLRYLNTRGCEAVSDDSIIFLARSCPRLRALDIGKCDVTDAGLRNLAESCPNLKKLSLKNCDMITNEGIQFIAYYCRGLQQLNIQDCQISIEGYRAVKKYCKRCTIEHTNPGFC